MPRKLNFSLFIYFLCTELKKTDFCVNLYKMLNSCTRYHIPHHIGTKQCSSVLPSCTYTALQCSLSCSHSTAALSTTLWSQIRWSIVVSSFWIDLSPVWHVQHVAPAVTILANCSSDVLHKSCFGWRKSIHSW